MPEIGFWGAGGRFPQPFEWVIHDGTLSCFEFAVLRCALVDFLRFGGCLWEWEHGHAHCRLYD